MWKEGLTRPSTSPLKLQKNKEAMTFGIIAAGQGSRLVEEGISTPKPLVKVGGIPMIERLIGIFRGCGAESINVVVNEEMTEVEEKLRQLQKESDVPINIIRKTTPSSMHSLLALAENLKKGDRCIVTTVDTIFRPEEFQEYARRWEETDLNETDALMGVTSYVEDEKPLYVETDPELNILAFRDAAWPEAKYVSGGLYGLSGTAFPVLEDCVASGNSRMRNFQRALIASGLRLKAHEFSKVIDVDHQGDIKAANDMLGTNN